MSDAGRIGSQEPKISNRGMRADEENPEAEVDNAGLSHA